MAAFWTKAGEGKNYKLVNSPKAVSWLFNKLKTVELCAIDIETSHKTALQMAVQHDVVIGGISFSWQKNQAAYLPLYTGRGQETWWKRDDVFDAILDKLEAFLSGPCEKVGQNIKFDAAWIFRVLGIVTKNIVFDTMLAHHLLDEEGVLTCRHGLKPMAKYYIDPQADRYEKELKQALDHYDPIHRRYTEVDIEILYIYACSDADYTLQLMHIFEPMLEQQGLLDLLYETVMPLSHVCMLIEIGGMAIDMEKNAELAITYKQRRDELTPLIYQASGFQFDIASSQQAAEVLYTRLNLPVQYGKKGQISTDKESLEKIKDLHPVVPLLGEYRSVEKLNTGYVESIRCRFNPVTRMLHPTFLIHGTVTGRISTEDPNVQNWPRPENGGIPIKAMFVAGEGHKICMADYSQIELRVAAHCSCETAWVSAFCNNIDVHSSTAKECYKLECHVDEVKKLFEEFRSRAKSINFGILYGMSAYGLAPRLHMTPDEAQAFIDLYFSRLPELKLWIDGVHQQAMLDGYVTNLFGRRRRLPDIQLFIPQRGGKIQGAPSCFGKRKEAPQLVKMFYPGMDFKTDMHVFSDAGRLQMLARDLVAKHKCPEKCTHCPLIASCAFEVERSYRQSLVNEAKRQSVNSLVQSAASDLAAKSFSQVLLVCKANGVPISVNPVVPGVRPWNMIHDELLFVVADQYVEQCSRIMRDVMINIFPQCIVPLDVDLEIVERLSDKHTKKLK